MIWQNSAVWFLCNTLQRFAVKCKYTAYPTDHRHRVRNEGSCQKLYRPSQLWGHVKFKHLHSLFQLLRVHSAVGQQEKLSIYWLTIKLQKWTLSTSLLPETLPVLWQKSEVVSDEHLTSTHCIVLFRDSAITLVQTQIKMCWRLDSVWVSHKIPHLHINSTCLR